MRSSITTTTTTPVLLLFLLLLLLFVSHTPQRVEGRRRIIVDVEGTVEDYAALTTIAQSPVLRNQLELVTVAGLTWGHATTVARNVRRFLALAHLDDVVVSIGARTAAVDAYDDVRVRGGCSRSGGFPATPHDARQRGMKYSRADVTNSFGAAYSLPLHSYNIQVNASEALYHVVSSMALSDTLTYLAFAGTSNVAAALNYITQHDPRKLQQFRQVTMVHIFEKGYSLAVDNVSTEQLLGDPLLQCTIYLPSFYDPAVTFSFSTWNQLTTLAKWSGTSVAVQWLYNAWASKKEFMESRDYNVTGDDPIMTFFRERGPASSLVTLCALEATLQTNCFKYRTSLSKISIQSKAPSETTTEGTESHFISGNNVTWPIYLLATPGNSDGATRFIFSQSADVPKPAGSTPLVKVFWSTWLGLLQD
ncbi:uncharacterized protein TM35_000202500 [Trypanosoma theileri]|uniref:Inosine/uridine-preferring nucleoside hydrolase domain-containing protein n=1 Tax=Trypanosoma theileri TaxID=67003 RepID=A0A1X0NTB2_9TRYP|nr:uncharacterized protein TM35_000202500 [Trypanosoma theileri]ORC87841.1 hypothetical protein TM35_000202500 [Trypanosoma theileri]